VALSASEASELIFDLDVKSNNSFWLYFNFNLSQISLWQIIKHGKNSLKVTYERR